MSTPPDIRASLDVAITDDGLMSSEDKVILDGSYYSEHNHNPHYQAKTPVGLGTVIILKMQTNPVSTAQALHQG